MSANIISHTHLTCPVCGFREELEIPTDYCLFFHRCVNCNIQIRPAPGDCCVFCSYGDTLWLNFEGSPPLGKPAPDFPLCSPRI